MSGETALILLIALPFAGSIAAMLLPANARNAAATLAGAVALASLFAALSCYGQVASGRVIRVAFAWLPAGGIDFALRMDGYAWMFAIIVTGIGFLVLLYSRYYMSPQDPVPRFHSFLLAFMGAMLGVVLSGNLIVLVFFWELTSLASFLLIGYWHHNAAARDGARMALIVTSAGGFCLLAGMLIVGHIVGSYDLDRVLGARDLIVGHRLYVPALVLILLGALTKSAQFPFHFWLPQAMAAPTPVSAYLHSAAMVKLGVFLMARFWPVLSGTDAWIGIVGTAGLVTFAYGAYAAIFQRDIKGLLAYSTISHLGLITLLLGLNSPLGCVAAIFHMLNHATFKASLFMATGIIDHETGTRDITRLSGLYRFMPITATLATVAAAAMAGVPLLNGFLSKEMFFAEALQVEGPVPLLDRALPYVVTVAAMFSVAYSLRFIHGVFFGPDPVDLPRQPREPPRWVRLPIDVLVLVCVVVGVFPQQTIGPLLSVAVGSVLGDATPAYSLSPWHGWTLPLFMSAVALAGGAALFFVLGRYFARAGEGAPLLPNVNVRRVFDVVLVALSWRWARTLLRWMGTERLQPQLRWLVLLAVTAPLWPVYHLGLGGHAAVTTALDPALAITWVLGGACAVGAAWQAKFHRLAALVLAGGAGLVTCLTFVWFSAPDLALTQLMVEIVTTVLMLLGLRWLPKRLPQRRSWTAMRAALPRRLVDLLIAVGAGGGLATLAYVAMTRSLHETVSAFYVRHAYPDGGGTNVVNVILVDFRGFDTLGEITVLAAVAIAVYSLLRRFRPARESIEWPTQQRTQDPRAAADDLLVASVIMRGMFAAIAVFAVFLLLRGHNLPGGGFAAGIALAVAFILQYMAGGTRWFEERIRLRPVMLMGIGLAIAAATGAGAWWFGYPFLTSHVAHIELPLVGAMHLPSAFLFDVGVFILVIGATALFLVALAHQSLRAHRGEREPGPSPSEEGDTGIPPPSEEFVA
ncbi:MAG TPA: monovalent cation/H+ antiporter subunit A [Casimicrobiaceae bacterium]|nr:monovalent cation/H+ antiporter subunit A [Casimicrobiaceae bacterium]